MQFNQIPFDYQKKVVLVGDHAVGKTSLLIRFAENTYQAGQLATIGIDFKLKIVQVKDLSCKLQIWDRSGTERFRSLTTEYYRGANGIIIIYDVSDRVTFNSISKHLKSSQEAIDTINPSQQIENIQYMLVGSKTDLKEREVSREEGEKFANESKMIFFEVSSLSSENVVVAFQTLAKEIISQQTHYKPLQNMVSTAPIKRYNCI